MIGVIRVLMLYANQSAKLNCYFNILLINSCMTGFNVDLQLLES